MPPRTTALILAREGKFLGLDLTYRAGLVVSRAGIQRVHLAGRHANVVTIVGQLRALGLQITWTPDNYMPFKLAAEAHALVVLDANTIVEPATVARFVEEALANEGRNLAAITSGRVTSIAADGKAADTGLAVVSPGGLVRIRMAASVPEALQTLARAAALHVASSADGFCKRIDTRLQIPQIEREYLSNTGSHRSECFVTRQIQRASIPVSQRLLRIGVTANQVTAAAFGFALLAGLVFSAGGYRAGVVGALLSLFSTVLDFSDGEVARGSLTASPLGARLETIAGYLSGFAVLGGIALGDVNVSAWLR